MPIHGLRDGEFDVDLPEMVPGRRTSLRVRGPCSDGYVAGVWRPVEDGIEATAFHRLPVDVWEQLATEACALVALLADREPRVYRRYDRWWNRLPGVEVRLPPG